MLTGSWSICYGLPFCIFLRFLCARANVCTYTYVLICFLCFFFVFCLFCLSLNYLFLFDLTLSYCYYLDACLFSDEREKKGCGLGGSGGGGNWEGKGNRMFYIKK